MTENQNGISETAPKLQKRLAAAKKNRRRRYIGNALSLIAILLIGIGATVDGVMRDLCFIAVVFLMPVAGHLLSCDGQYR